jgi:hypothetical protein
MSPVPADPTVIFNVQPAEPRPFGVSTAAIPVETNRIDAFVGQTICDPVQVVPDASTCAGFNKTLIEEPSDVIGNIRGVLYIGDTCKGPTTPEFQKALMAAFANGEDWGLALLMQNYFNTATITAWGAVADIKAAIARVESELDKIPTQGVIYLSIEDYYAAEPLIVTKGSRLETMLGTKVVVSSAFTTGTVRATGRLYMSRSAGDLKEVFDPTTNENVRLVEKFYRLGYECVIGQATVAVTP